MFDSSWVDLNRISTPLILITSDIQVTWDMNIIYGGPGVYPNSNAYGKHYRMSLVSTGASDLMCKSHVSSTYHLSMYDIYCPFRQNNLPVIEWVKYASDTIWPTVYLYHTCLLRVADKNGNAISGVMVTLKDSGGVTEKSAVTNTDATFWMKRSPSPMLPPRPLRIAPKAGRWTLTGARKLSSPAA